MVTLTDYSIFRLSHPLIFESLVPINSVLINHTSFMFTDIQTTGRDSFPVFAAPKDSLAYQLKADNR